MRNFSQKPRDLNLYCVTDVAKSTGCSAPTVHRIAKQLNIVSKIFATHNARAAYFTEEEMRTISDTFNSHGNDYKLIKPVKQIVEASAEDHPLVEDKRWLKLLEWPDTIPDCFKEVD